MTVHKSTEEFITQIIEHCKKDGFIKTDADSTLLMEASIRLSTLQRRIDNWAEYEEKKL